MDPIERLVAYALFLTAVVWAPASSLAQSPWDGTWRITYPLGISPKPVVFSVNNGIYDCSSCSPKIDVQADGQDHSVIGQAYDTISVREVDPKSIVIMTKKSGKTVSEQTRAVSDDGNTLKEVKLTHRLENSDQMVSEETTSTRIGEAPVGANVTSGSWRADKATLTNLFTYATSGDELRLSEAIGASYTAKLDGKDYPTKGEPYGLNSVSLKRVDDRTIEETSKRDGKAVIVYKMTVAPDGKKMTVVVTAVTTGRTSTYVAEKQ